MIIVSNIFSAPEQHRVALAVETRGMTIVVRAGGFRYGGVDYVLAEDQEFTVAPTETTDLVGYLVLDRGEPKLLVDEVTENDLALDVRRDTTFTPLHAIFMATVVPGMTSLDSAAVRVRHLVEEGS